MGSLLPNRVAVYLTGAIALLGALAPVIADMDWESTAGVIAALLVILGIAREWLVNWGKWERSEGAGLLDAPPDLFDEDDAEPPPDHIAGDAQERGTTLAGSEERDPRLPPQGPPDLRR